MFLAVDIGGTKTLLAVFDARGHVSHTHKFPTPEKYQDFLQQFRTAAAKLPLNDISAAAVAVPGRIDRVHGRGLGFGNLKWPSGVPIQADIEKIINTPVVIENDAKLGGLSEASLIKKDFKRVLYVTISTGIGTGVITNGVIDAELADSEGGAILLEHHGKLQKWEHFASGKAIFKRYGKPASQIKEPDKWQEIAHNIAIGLIDLIAAYQPEVIVFGGGVGNYFQRFHKFLVEELKKYETPLTPIPPLQKADRPEEAVIYGCYELLRQRHAAPAH